MSPRGRTARPAPGAAIAGKPAKRRRPAKVLTQGQLITKLTKLVQVQQAARSSVEIERGPRGQIMLTVNVHQGDEPGISTIAEAAARASQIFDELATKYPPESAAGGGKDG